MKLYRSEGITIHISRDGMLAKLSISGRGKTYPDLSEITSALDTAGVKFGLDSIIIEEISKRGEPVNEVTVARGQAQAPGEEGRIIWALNIASGNVPKIRTDGKADFRHLSQYEAVKKDDEILSLLPGTQGVQGQTVTGLPVQVTKPKIVSIPTGKNTRLSEDGLTLYSAVDGVAMLQGDEVIIDTICHIKGDVNFSTGNVKYQGTVLIDGDVRSGFRVEATDSIHINGTVEAAEIYSKSGSIFIQNGILGRNRARILAGDTLECGFMQDATVSVKNDVIIKHYAMNSKITSGGKVILIKNEGVLRGGKTIAEKGIELLVAGSEQNVLTELVLTRSDMGEEQSMLWQAKTRLTGEQEKLDMLIKRMEFLELLRQRLHSLSDERMQELERLRKDISVVKKSINKAEQEAQGIATETSERFPESIVKIRKQLHRKVTVTIGYKKYFSTTINGGVSIYRQGDEMFVRTMD